MKLTPLRDSDWPTLQAWYSDPVIVRSVALEPPDPSRAAVSLAIRLEDGTLVGTLDLFNIDTQNLKAEVGIAIPDKRGRGLSLRAGRAGLTMVYKQTELHRLTARVAASNTQARRLLGLLGFEEEGVEEDAFLRDGNFEDVVIYGILFPARPGRSEHNGTSPTVHPGSAGRGGPRSADGSDSAPATDPAANAGVE